MHGCNIEIIPFEGAELYDPFSAKDAKAGKISLIDLLGITTDKMSKEMLLFQPTFCHNGILINKVRII